MLHTIGIILLIAGFLAIIAGTIIFFVTDCREAFLDLRTTNTIMPQEEELPAISDIYYDSYAHKEEKPKEKPRFVMENEADHNHVPISSKESFETSPLATASEEPLEEVSKETSPLSMELDAFEDTAPLREELQAQSFTPESFETAPLTEEEAPISEVSYESFSEDAPGEFFETAPLTADKSPSELDTAPLIEDQDDGLSFFETIPSVKEKAPETEPLKVTDYLD